MESRDYVNLCRLGRHRIRSEEDYRTFQAFQATLLLKYLRGFGIEIEGKRVLDLGSGIGGYSEEMGRHGATVISLDLIKPPQERVPGCVPVVASALSIPLCDERIDFVFCASLIEHVYDPAGLLAEIRRTLVEGGGCYLSFPPFYSPLGGHEFSPFHYLGESLAMRLARRHSRHPQWVRDRYKISPSPRSFSETYQDWGLYKMTVAKAKRLIYSSGLKMVNMSTRYLPMSMIRWPILGEILTWHAQFLLVKPC
jgi:SAM-dependent methyltransferase